MRALSVAALLAVAAVCLTGCNPSGELEKQAYVLVLGVDRLDGGDIELTARVPRIGGKDANGKQREEQDGGAYLVFSGRGDGYARALEALQWATPRRMNLSHIETLVVSEALAREDGFAALASRIAETPHLYTTARFIVCAGTARAFVEAQEPVIGARLSEDIDAMLDHYAEQGFIPRGSFADAYYAFNSIYGDPTAILSRATGKEDAAPAAALIGGTDEGGASPTAQRYGGAALFREGRMVGALDMAQTALLNLCLGATRVIPFDCDGNGYELTVVGMPERRAVIEADGPKLSLDLAFTTLDGVCDAEAEELEAQLQGAFSGLIADCQALGCDPFGFAESAAGAFASVPEWLAYDWRARYAQAPVEVHVSVNRTG